MKIVADQNIPFVKEYFSEQGDLVLKPGRSIVYNDVKDADILLIRSITPVNQYLLADTSIRFVGSITAGIDHLDTAWLDQAGIAWCVAQGFNAPSVVEYVMHIIALLKQEGTLSSSSLTAAVIGVGHVGSLIVERLRSMGFKVLQVDPLRATINKNFISATLEQVENVDLITLHVPLVHDGDHPTYHFIDKNFLKRQRPGCVLMNTSRGAVISSDVLKKYGSHLHWCLDVWENEPHIDKEILRHAIIATPHIAGYSIQSKNRGIAMIYQQVCERKMITPKPNALQLSSRPSASLFNPKVITRTMKKMLDVAHPAEYFDALRLQWNEWSTSIEEEPTQILAL